MDDDQQFCLRWNNHQSTLISVFDTLLEKGIHVDCTLAAEGQTLKAHKVVLSACSPYFESVLSQQYDKHPIIILKDVKYAELRAMMDYMYRGEVNISQDQLAALLKAAESLQIKGLSDNKPPPRTSSPSLKGRVLETASTGHLHSREGSSSPAPRKRKKPRRASADSININSSEHIPSLNHTPIQPPAPIKNNIEHIENDVVVPIKVNKVSNDIVNDVMKNNNKSELADDAKLEFEEGNEDSVEDLTLDEEADSEVDSAHPISAGPSIGQGDVVQSFQWHMERSQDEVINSQDSQRDSQDASVQTLDSNKEIKSLLGVPVIDLDLETSLLDEEFDGDESDSSILQFSNKKYLILKPDDEELKQLISNTVQKNLIPSVETKTEDTVSSGLDDSKENDKIIMNEPASEEKGESKKSDAEMSSPQQPSLPCAQYATAKGYKCPNCQRVYNARKNLVRHINLECGREPQYKCPYCSHGNHRRNELKRHIQKKHPDKPDCDVPSKVAC